MIWKFPEKKWHIGLHCLVKSQHLRIFQAAIVGTPTESSKVVTFCNLVVLTLLLDGRSNWWLVRFLRKKVGVGWVESDEGRVHLFTFCLFVHAFKQETPLLPQQRLGRFMSIWLIKRVFCVLFWTGSGVEVFPSDQVFLATKTCPTKKQWWNLPQTKIAPEKGWFFNTTSTFLLGQKGLFLGTTLVSGMKQQRVLRFKGYILCCMYAFISVGGTKPLRQQGRAFQEVLASCNADSCG